MPMTCTDNGTELVYESSEVKIIIAKSDTHLIVQQTTPLEHANGQTWTDLKNYLDTKVGL